jgi:hypothetical protein
LRKHSINLINKLFTNGKQGIKIYQTTKIAVTKKGLRCRWDLVSKWFGRLDGFRANNVSVLIEYKIFEAINATRFN